MNRLAEVAGKESDMSRETYLDQVAELAAEKSQGITPRECAKAGMPLPPTELILLENALTIAERRIAELEQRQKWIDEVARPDHPDDERPWCKAYLDIRFLHLKTMEQLASKNLRIAELESALEWHPASEPPEDDRQVVTELNNGKFEIDYYWRPNYTEHRWKYGHENVVRWCDIPPIGKESR
jgi:hypothetical protein